LEDATLRIKQDLRWEPTRQSGAKECSINVEKDWILNLVAFRVPANRFT
jgi:hypothetical protein